MPAQEIELSGDILREISLCEQALQDVDTEITAKQYLMSKDILTARQSIIAKIPNFWPVVFENAASEIDCAFTPADMAIISESLIGLEVWRHEISPSASVNDSGLASYGEPRSVTIRFIFKEDNQYFTESSITKVLNYRYGKDGSAGLVSDPVPIQWKDGKDVTEGLTTAAYQFWQAQQARPDQKLDGVLNKSDRLARDAAAVQMPEYKALAEKVQQGRDAGFETDDDDESDSKDTEWNGRGAASFFNFFSYRGRWVSPAETVQARAEAQAKRQARQEGKDVKDDDDEDDDDEDFAEEDVETFPLGHEVAVSIAEDLWPAAIDYYLGRVTGSDVDFDDLGEDEDEDVDMS